MEIKTEIKEGRVPVAVIFVSGDINTLTFSELEEQGKRLYEGGSRRMVLDFTNVRYINSAGLRAIHTIYKVLRTNFPEEADDRLQQMILKNSKSKLLKIVGPNRTIRELLLTSGYDRFLEVHDTVDSAVASF